MIILPETHHPSTRFLMPVHAAEWRAPSRALPKDELGNSNVTRFRLTARINDGHIVWRGWFDDRGDADAFLWALARGTLRIERELWDLPVETWTPREGYGRLGWRPDLGEHLSYEFATQTFLTAPTGSNQTYSVPSDWNSANNTIDTIAAGGSGGASIANSAGAFRSAAGGGGGAWNRVSNLSLTPGGSATYQIGSAGTAATATGTSVTAGNAGGDSWFNGATIGASSVGSKAGAGGGASTSTNSSGGAGGVGASGVGSSSNNGGRGGNYTGGGGSSGSPCTGGGGAAGASGAGNNGVDLASLGTTATNGGSGDAGSGGAAGTTNGGNGGNGTEYDATHGSGGGGASATHASTNQTGGTGGLYGAGGGAACTFNSGAGTNTSGAGRQGMIVVTYTPLSVFGGNMPMLGM